MPRNGAGNPLARGMFFGGAFLFVFLSSHVALGQSPDPRPFPPAEKAVISLPEGGLRLILLPRETSVRSLDLGGARVRFFPWRNGKGQAYRAALVGVDFSRQPGPVPLIFHGAGGSFRGVVLVRSRPFTVSKLQVAPSFVVPPEGLLRRIARERRVILRALAASDAPLRFRQPFILPLDGRPTHDFGAYRYLNGRPMARHSGEDIDAPSGTPVRAANSGVVRLSGSFYYDGNMVIIDHGGRLLTEYLHMSDRLVHAGDIVRQGEVIGHVGHTGRVTGPVLHYGAVLHGEHVSPLLLSGLLDHALVLQDPFARERAFDGR